MKIENFFQMNDWDIIRFLKMVSAIQLLVWSLIGLNYLGTHIPFIQQIVCFLYLTFIPGFVLLRILRIHRWGNIESTLLAAGLSLAMLMLTGVTVNTFLPLLGIPDPLSLPYLMVSISFIVIILCIIAYLVDKSTSMTEWIDLKDVITTPALIVCFLPFLMVIGAFLVNYYNSNLVMLFDISMIALVVILVIFTKLIPAKYYPLTVLSMTVSILLHNALISSYIAGWDVNSEYYWADLVITNSFWNSHNISPVNGMLGIVMLAPIFSKVCNIDLSWTLKLVYPLLFSLISLAIYRIAQKQTDDKIAFLSCFFFISLFTFYTEMLSLCRQQIAEFFLAILILLFINKGMSNIKQAYLIIIFTISMIVSHYGLSYIYMTIFAITWAMLFVAERPSVEKITRKIKGLYMREEAPRNGTDNTRTINLTFLLIFATMTFAWYIFVSSYNFLSIVHIGNQITSSISSEFLNPQSSQGLSIITSANVVTPLHVASKYIHFAALFFILIGVLVSITIARTRMSREFKVFGLINLGLCLASISVPYFASSLNTTRVYQISLIVMAPFAILGGIAIIDLFRKIIAIILNKAPAFLNETFPLKVLSIFIILFLLFNISFIYELFRDGPNSISISQSSIKKFNDTASMAAFYRMYQTENDVTSAVWLGDHRLGDTEVFADYPRIRSTLTSYGKMESSTKEIMDIYFNGNPDKKSYIYLGYFNTKNRYIDEIQIQMPVEIISSDLQESNLIYDNNGSQIYLTG